MAGSTSGPERYRVAVAGGAGFWGARYLRAFSQRSDCDIVALVDTAQDRRVDVAREYAITAVYDTVDDLLEDDVPDILSTSLPVAATYGAVLAAADAGVRAIACEKPLSASLRKADEMVDVCRDRGIPFACGTALWEVDHLDRVAGWVGEGHIGRMLSASVPSGLPAWVSGNGCVQLNWLRFATRMEAVWVEDAKTWPPEAATTEDDCGVSGTIGLSGGITCDIPAPANRASDTGGVFIEGSGGGVEVVGPQPVFTTGVGDRARRVVPGFCEDRREDRHADWLFSKATDNMIRSCRGGGEAPCSGHDYRQVLEIALALKLSARAGGKRVELPLADRDQVINPAPWRMLGGDVAGWLPGLEPRYVKVRRNA